VHPTRKMINRLMEKVEQHNQKILECYRSIVELENELRNNPDHEHQWHRENHVAAQSVCTICEVIQ
jgi:uncharacterized coiled-coil DUF342 family protein